VDPGADESPLKRCTKRHAQNVPAENVCRRDVSAAQPPTNGAAAGGRWPCRRNGRSPRHRSLRPGDVTRSWVHVDAPVRADADAPGQSVLRRRRAHLRGKSRRLACDESRVRDAHNDPEAGIVEVGARTRTIPRARWGARAFIAIRGCRFRDVGYGFSGGDQGQSHPPLGSRRPHDALESAMLVARHHRALHEEAYQVERSPTASCRLVAPDGRPLPESPALPAVPPTGRTLRARHAECGLNSTRDGVHWWTRELPLTWMGASTSCTIGGAVAG